MAAHRQLKKLLASEHAARSNNDAADVLRADRHFLFALYRHCQVPMLLSMIEAAWLRRGPHFWDARWLIAARTPKGSYHDDVLDAICRQDADEAANVLCREIRGTTTYLLKQMHFAEDTIERTLTPVKRPR